MTTSSSTNLNPPRNPCTDEDFQPPVYEFTNATASVKFDARTEYGTDYTSTVKFGVTDIANNYSLLCTWSAWQFASTNWFYACEPEAGSQWSTPLQKNLVNLVPESLIKGKTDVKEPVRLVQYWYCDIKNQSYPEMFQSRAAVFFNFACPTQGERGVDYACNTTATTSPIRVKAEWPGRGALPQTPQLIPRPTQPGPAPKGLDPPPKSDCTLQSLSYAQWDLTAFSALPGGERWEMKMGRVNLTLTSRATGVRWDCKIDGPSTNDGTETQLNCTSQQPAQQPESRNVIKVWASSNTYNIQNLRIDEEWVCGDPNGTYSTVFSATSASGGNPGRVTVPVYNSGNGILVAEPMTIRGAYWLGNTLWEPARIPGPPNSKTPGCLARSQSEILNVWTITQFLYQRTTIAVSGGIFNFPNPPGPVPYNRTLQLSLVNNANGYTTSCSFSDPFLDDLSPDLWLPCNPTAPLHSFPIYTIPTSIAFNILTGELRVNQTWYCDDSSRGTPFVISALGSTRVAYPKLVGGHSSSTARGITCMVLIAPIFCDVTFSAEWWALGGDRDGRGNPIALGMTNFPSVDIKRLPDGALTEPDINTNPNVNAWSCMASSIGKGPVKWTIQEKRNSQDPLLQTGWFSPDVRPSDQLYSWFQFDLNSSVFATRPSGGGGGRGALIRDVGNRAREYESELHRVTPWLRGWDPTFTYSSGDRLTKTYAELGWDTGLYNVLDWKVRFDAATGYMELSHSWYCDDRNPDKP